MLKDDNAKEMITSEETDLLQEIMNIAFGRASADLAEYIDIFVLLSPPDVMLLQASDLPRYINRELRDCDKVSVVEQSFWGKFKGNAYLFFPSGTGKKIFSILGNGDELFLSDPANEMEKETFLEIGNILIGACIGKISELLGDFSTYSPPRVIVEKSSRDIVSGSLIAPGNVVIVLRTDFEFNEKNINGYLFVVTKQESFAWLKTALHKFLDQYA
ncbi:MAG: chemotaxis protein CheC [Smithella sp.]